MHALISLGENTALKSAHRLIFLTSGVLSEPSITCFKQWNFPVLRGPSGVGRHLVPVSWIPSNYAFDGTMGLLRHVRTLPMSHVGNCHTGRNITATSHIYFYYIVISFDYNYIYKRRRVTVNSRRGVFS